MPEIMDVSSEITREVIKQIRIPLHDRVTIKPYNIPAVLDQHFSYEIRAPIDRIDPAAVDLLDDLNIRLETERPNAFDHSFGQKSVFWRKKRNYDGFHDITIRQRRCRSHHYRH